MLGRRAELGRGIGGGGVGQRGVDLLVGDHDPGVVGGDCSSNWLRMAEVVCRRFSSASAEASGAGLPAACDLLHQRGRPIEDQPLGDREVTDLGGRGGLGGAAGGGHSNNTDAGQHH